jgi:membrane fusion protein (multidrug efflux system)
MVAAADVFRQGWATLRRLILPAVALIIALSFVTLASLRWNAWVGSASTQVTDDASVEAHITRLQPAWPVKCAPSR